MPGKKLAAIELIGAAAHSGRSGGHRRDYGTRPRINCSCFACRSIDFLLSCRRKSLPRTAGAPGRVAPPAVVSLLGSTPLAKRAFNGAVSRASNVRRSSPVSDRALRLSASFRAGKRNEISSPLCYNSARSSCSKSPPITSGELMTKRIRKAVFPVAGLGTRFLPATKSIPKEMLTVVDRPVLQHVVDEACEAGIEHFIFVTGPQQGGHRGSFRHRL